MRRGEGRRTVVRVAITATVMAVVTAAAAWGATTIALADVYWG